MTDPAFRESDMITRKSTFDAVTYFRCRNCDAVAKMGGTRWECAGRKSGPAHDWAPMDLIDKPVETEVVDRAQLSLRRG